MSFIYGSTDTDELAGVTAILDAWPSLGGVSVESTAIPGTDGRVLAGVTRERTQFTFDVIIAGDTPQQVAERRDNLMGVLDPSAGPRALTVEFDTDWEWPDVLASDEVTWERFTWDAGVGFRLRAEVTFETVAGASARETSPQEVEFTSSTSFTLDTGNTSATPSILVQGAGSETTVSIGDFEVTVEPTSGWNLSLDWDRMRFYRVTSSGSRVSSLVGRMSNFDRPVLRRGETVQVSVSGSPAGVTLYPNARRI